MHEQGLVKEQLGAVPLLFTLMAQSSCGGQHKAAKCLKHEDTQNRRHNCETREIKC